jgi:hypothetical protein
VDPNGLVVLVDEALFSTTGRSLGFSLSATLSHLIIKQRNNYQCCGFGTIYSGSANNIKNNSGSESDSGLNTRKKTGKIKTKLAASSLLKHFLTKLPYR